MCLNMSEKLLARKKRALQEKNLALRKELEEVQKQIANTGFTVSYHDPKIRKIQRSILIANIIREVRKVNNKRLIEVQKDFGHLAHCPDERAQRYFHIYIYLILQNILLSFCYLSFCLFNRLLVWTREDIDVNIVFYLFFFNGLTLRAQ